jgi:hypothetical protein
METATAAAEFRPANSENSPPLENGSIPLGDLIDSAKRIAEARSELSAQDKKLKEQLDQLELLIIQDLDNNKTTLARGKYATASITESAVPQVADWEAFYQYILDNKALHMLDRKPNTGAFRELNDAGVTVPGVNSFTKRKLSLRKT